MYVMPQPMYVMPPAMYVSPPAMYMAPQQAYAAPSAYGYGGPQMASGPMWGPTRAAIPARSLYGY
jgi:hypothetical protein